MKFFPAIIGTALISIWTASAQVTVEVRTDQEQFLPNETLPVAVRISNSSGQTLHFGADQDWLHFSVESADGFIVLKNGEAPVLGEFDVQSSQVATRRVDLAPYFNLLHTGRYKVTARVHINEWNTDVTSAPKNFDIINGAQIWSQDFGLPLPEGVTNQMPEVRRYTLVQANYLKTQLRLYAQVTDQTGAQVYKVLPIGTFVSFSHPDALLDRANNLHVLWQTGSSAFTYVQISPNGDILDQNIYDYFNSRPRLKANDDGDINVLGGVPRRRISDTPLIMSPDEVGTPPVKATNTISKPVPAAKS